MAGLTKAEQRLAEYKSKERTLKIALREASSPERLFIGAAGGGIAAVGLNQLLDRQVTSRLIATPAGTAPGWFARNPNFTRGLVSAGVGAVIHVGNLALDYPYPMPLERELIHTGSACLLAIGVNKMVDNWPVTPTPPSQPPAPQK
jgi:hypothetical protein